MKGGTKRKLKRKGRAVHVHWHVCFFRLPERSARSSGRGSWPAVTIYYLVFTSYAQTPLIRSEPTRIPGLA